ncbi:MAG: hypothetical protein HYW50_00290 [Candidatus Diapherotrites archaeon]|nr:hypothetical protein [Candidatus Diapherotrites archaeon]
MEQKIVGVQLVLVKERVFFLYRVAGCLVIQHDKFAVFFKQVVYCSAKLVAVFIRPFKAFPEIPPVFKEFFVGKKPHIAFKSRELARHFPPSMHLSKYFLSAISIPEGRVGKKLFGRLIFWLNCSQKHLLHSFKSRKLVGEKL